MLTRKRAKLLLEKRGWSYRSVAPVLGVHHIHLALVLTANKKYQRHSKRLLTAIEKLPDRERWRAEQGRAQ